MDGATTQDAFTVDQFCRRNSISRAFLYLLWQRGQGPRYMQLGTRRLISAEAAADWRREREATTAGATKAA